MKYSNSDVLKRVQSAKRDKKNLTHITDKSTLSTEDRMKIGLCKHFVQFLNRNKVLLKDVAKKTGIPITRLSEITNYKINLYTVDKLVQHLAILGKHDSEIKEYLILLENAAEVPVLKIKETRKLARNLREASVHA